MHTIDQCTCTIASIYELKSIFKNPLIISTSLLLLLYPELGTKCNTSQALKNIYSFISKSTLTVMFYLFCPTEVSNLFFQIMWKCIPFYYLLCFSIFHRISRKAYLFSFKTILFSLSFLVFFCKYIFKLRGNVLYSLSQPLS